MNQAAHRADDRENNEKITRDYTACACSRRCCEDIIERQVQLHKAILETLKDARSPWTNRGDSHKATRGAALFRFIAHWAWADGSHQVPHPAE